MCSSDLRLRGQWQHLERMEGAIGSRGPGETQLETDRRLIGLRIARLKRQIDDVRRQRALHRRRRERDGVPVVALVGYTNAGKSSLLRAMAGVDAVVARGYIDTARMGVTGGSGGGLLTNSLDLVRGILDNLGLKIPEVLNIPQAGATTAELAFMTVGASDVHAFVGIGGPYFVDLDGNGAPSWSFDTGDGDDASRTLVSGSVTIGTTTYAADGANKVLPRDTVVTLPDGALVTVGTRSYGDLNLDHRVDDNETGELNPNAKGLVIDSFDFGLALMRPTNPLQIGRAHV